MSRVRARLSGHSNIGVAAVDQVLSSGSNVIVALMVARELDARSLGAYALAFTVFALGVELTRAVGGEVLAIRIGEVDHEDSIGAVAGVSAMMGVLLAAGSAGAGVLIGGEVGMALVTMGGFVVFAVVQDALRNGFITIGRPGRALVSDAIWLVVQVGALVWLASLSRPSASAAVVAWGSAALVATVATVALYRVRLRLREAFAWLAEGRALWPRLLGEAVVRAGFGQLMLVLIAAVAGAAALGRLRAAQIILGPASMAILLAPVLAVPEAARQSSVEGLRRVAKVTAGALVAISVASGLVAMAVPHPIGRMILRENWDEALPLIPVAAAMFAASGLVTGAMAGLRGARRVDLTLWLRAVSGPAIAIAAAGAATIGIQAAAWAVVVVRLALAVVSWRLLRALSHRPAPTEPAVMG